MPSFPTRITRASFGPERKNLGGVVGNPEFNINAADWKLIFWQLTGSGLTCPLLTFAFLTATTTVGLSRQSYAPVWDPYLDLGPTYDPVMARSSAGIYTITFPNSVPDVDGNDAPIELTDAFCQPKIVSTARWAASAEVTASNVVTVTLSDDTGTRQDLKSAAPVRIFFAAWSSV